MGYDYKFIFYNKTRKGDKMSCDVKRCRGETEYIYYGREVCDKHWQYHCNKTINLKKIFKIIKKEVIVINPISENKKSEGDQQKINIRG